MDYLYTVFLSKELYAYSYDINDFFNYIRQLYMIDPEIVIEIKKEKINLSKSTFSIENIDSDLEIVEFYNGIYMTYKEFYYWDKYFQGFYKNTVEYFKERNKSPIEIQSYEFFMDYLGNKTILKIISSVDRNYIDIDREMEDEFNRLIERDN